MKTNYLIGIIVMLLNYAQAQNLEWVKSAGSTASERAKTVAVDSQGNVYTVGTFNNTVDFDPSSTVYNLTSNGNKDIFIQKLDASGNFVWAKSFGGSEQEDAYAIVIDMVGNIYIAGKFRDTVDFDPNANTYNLISKGYYDAFIQKLDANGNFVWAKSMGSSKADVVTSIAVDGLGNVYAAGYFYETVDFDPDTATYSLSSSGSGDGFVQKLDANGNFVWAHAMGGDGFDGASGLALDNDNNVYTVGYFRDTVDFDPNVNTSYSLTSNGYQDIFVQKLDSDGNFIWAKTVGGAKSDYPYAVAVDAASNVYTVGYFQNSVDFDPDTSVYNITSNGSRDAFIQKLDGNGNFVWAQTVGGTSRDDAKSVAVDHAGNVYTVGSFQDQIDLDPSTNVYNVSAVGGGDVFIQKLASDGTFMWGGAIIGADKEDANAIVVDGLDNIYTVGYFRDTVDFDLDTSVYSLTSNGSDDAFVQKISQGCNTIVTGVDSIVACDSYTWIDGNTYTSNNNTATYTLTNALGCDSVVTLDLTIVTVDTSVTLFSNILRTNVTSVTVLGTVDLVSNASGASYQWIDCNNGNMAIAGETAQRFTPTAPGDYAVVVTQNGCVDTSKCINVTFESLDDLSSSQEVIKIHPNPTTGKFVIDIQDLNQAIATIYTRDGRLVKTVELKGQGQHSLEFNEVAGVYFIHIQAKNKSYYKKLIKE